MNHTNGVTFFLEITRLHSVCLILVSRFLWNDDDDDRRIKTEMKQLPMINVSMNRSLRTSRPIRENKAPRYIMPDTLKCNKQRSLDEQIVSCVVLHTFLKCAFDTNVGRIVRKHVVIHNCDLYVFFWNNFVLITSRCEFMPCVNMHVLKRVSTKRKTTRGKQNMFHSPCRFLLSHLSVLTTG